MKWKYDKKEDIPAQFVDMYEQRDGAYYLKIEGMPSDPGGGGDGGGNKGGGEDVVALKAKLAEFRNNNITERQAREAAEAEVRKIQDQFKGIDVADVGAMQAALATIQQAEEKELFAKGEFDEIVNRRMKRAANDHQEALGAKDTKIKDLETQLKEAVGYINDTTVDENIRKAIDTAGVRVAKGAERDLMSRARSVWNVDDKRKLQARDENGTAMVNGDGDPYTPVDFVQSLVKDAPFLFEAAKGAGGGGKGSGDGPSGSDVKVVPPSEQHNYVKEIAAGSVRVDHGGGGE